MRRPHSSASSPVAVRENLPPRRTRARRALCVHRHHNALRAVAPGGLFDQLRPLHRCGVDAHLVGARVEQALHVPDRTHAPAHRQRDKDLLCNRLDDAHDQVAAVARGRDVEKRKLVSALLVIAPRDLDRVTGVAQPDEIDPLHDAPGGNVEAGDDALGQAHPE
jgi:hypothetical protein